MNKTIQHLDKDFVVLKNANIKNKFFIYNFETDEFRTNLDGITPCKYDNKYKALNYDLGNSEIIVGYSKLPDHVKMLLR